MTNIDELNSQKVELIKAVEKLAEYFYNQMPYDEDGEKPAWVEGGNSLKQDEARRKALSSIDKPEKE